MGSLGNRLTGVLARAACFATAAGLAGALGACGSSAPTLGTASLQRAAATSILRQRGVRAQVSCPGGVPRRAGFRFWCMAHLDVGSYPLLMDETGGGGRVRYENSAPLRVLRIGRVEQAIAARLARAGLKGARVRCPQEVIERAGVRFSCSARAQGRDMRFAVRELDGAGRVRFVEQL